jgi:hypothetical protein
VQDVAPDGQVAGIGLIQQAPDQPASGSRAMSTTRISSPAWLTMSRPAGSPSTQMIE